jgi:hypothetical protein
VKARTRGGIWLRFPVRDARWERQLLVILYRILLTAVLGLGLDCLTHVVESGGPLEYGGAGRIVALQVAVQPSRRFGVNELGIAENLFADLGEPGIVGLQFFAGVHVIVIVVVFAVVVEPGLHAFGEILGVIYGGVFGFPEPLLHRPLVYGLEPVVEGLVHLDHPAQMNVVGEFVNQDVFLVIRVTLVGEHVFLRAGTDGVGSGSAQTARAGIPIILGSKLPIFGDVRGEFVVSHDDHARATGDHGALHVGASGQHHVDEVGGFPEGEVIDLSRTHNRIATCAHVLLVEGVELHRSRWFGDLIVGGTKRRAQAENPGENGDESVHWGVDRTTGIGLQERQVLLLWEPARKLTIRSRAPTNRGCS